MVLFEIFLILQGKTLVLPSNEAQLRIYNNFDCDIAISGSLVGNFNIEPLDVLRINYSSTVFNGTNILSIDVHIHPTPTCQLKASTLNQHVFVVKERVRIIMIFFYIINLFIEKTNDINRICLFYL